MHRLVDRLSTTPSVAADSTPGQHGVREACRRVSQVSEHPPSQSVELSDCWCCAGACVRQLEPATCDQSHHTTCTHVSRLLDEQHGWLDLNVWASEGSIRDLLAGHAAPVAGTQSASSRGSPSQSVRGDPPRAAASHPPIGSHYLPGTNVEVGQQALESPSEERWVLILFRKQVCTTCLPSTPTGEHGELSCHTLLKGCVLLNESHSQQGFRVLVIALLSRFCKTVPDLACTCRISFRTTTTRALA